MSHSARQFRPTWWATLGTLLLGGLFITAGAWQLGRAEEKRALVALFEQGAAARPMAPPKDDSGIDQLRYRTVTATGRYDGTHQVLLDARTRDGRAGYEVLTPLRRHDGPAILVNRGWTAASPDRRRLPEIGVDGAPRTVSGLLDRLPRAALSRAAPPAGRAEPWPRRMLFPTAADIGQALGYPVADYQLLLDPAEADGLRRDWRPSEMTPAQHVGYAVQWFALAVALVVLYAVLNWRKPSAGQPQP